MPVRVSGRPPPAVSLKGWHTDFLFPMQVRKAVLVALLVAAGGLVLLRAQAPATVTVTVNRAVRHQAILGWGGTLSFSRNLNHIEPVVVDQLIDDLVDVLGLTFLRVLDGVLDEPFNDNADPNVIDFSRFRDGPAIDREVTRGLRRFVDRVKARGLAPTIMLVKDWRGDVPSWMTDPEVAEHLLATVKYYKDRHDTDITFVAVANEPDPARFSPHRYSRIAPLFDRLARAEGLTTRLMFDEGRTAGATLSAAQAVGADQVLWSLVGLLAWHGPGSTTTVRTGLRDFAAARQIPTAMTGSPGATIADLFADLTEANVSYWARNSIVESGPSAEANESSYFATGFDGVSFRHNQAYHRFREVMGFVPVGAVRVDASASNPALRVAAFEKDNALYLVGLNTSTVHLRATLQGITSFADVFMFNHFSGPDGITALFQPWRRSTNLHPLEIPAGEVAAFVPEPGIIPIPGRWLSTPMSVTLPMSEPVQLRARGVAHTRFSDFGNLQPVVVNWDPVSGPTMSFGFTDSGGDASVTGLTVPGTYEFRALFTEPFSPQGPPSSTRTLRLRVYAGNQAPVITEGYRYYRDEWIVAPRSGQTYGADFISAGDIEGDPVTTSFSVVSQPQGANATFTGATVTGMTRPGDYVFRFTASDPGHTVTRDFVRRVVAAEPTAPASGARRRPDTTPPTGLAGPRPSSVPGGTQVSSRAQATTVLPVPKRMGMAGPRRRIVPAETVRDLLEALAAGESSGGLPRWSRIALVDLDDDGAMDVVQIEFVDGSVVVWRL